MAFQFLDLGKCTFSSMSDLDRQQREFVEQCNNFLREYKKDAHLPFTESIIIYLSDYTKSYFMAQESLMVTHQYPHAKTHAAAHNEFVREVAKLLKSLLSFKRKRDVAVLNSLATQVCVLVTDWFESHVVDADIRLNEFIKFEINRNES